VRRLLSAVTVAAGVAGFVAVPVVARPVAQAHAVAPHVYRVAVPTRPDGHGTLAAATRLRTRFNLVGATWQAGTLDAGTTALEVRVLHGSRWSDWTGLGAEDGGADRGTADASRAVRVHAGTQTAEPMWVGDASGVQARVVAAVPHSPSATMPGDLHLVLVDSGTSAADADPRPSPVLGGDVAAAAVAQPAIYTRADWGADESMRKKACPAGPDYAPTVQMGFIHHTDGGNGYSRAQVPAIIRGIYAYHVKSNGWCDVGYNYLVDRFGRIWEGRYGGITKAVVGAHTGGYNYDSFGVSLIGTFNASRPGAATLSAVEQLFAWRLGAYYRDPLGKTVMTDGGFSGSRHSAGDHVRFNIVSGHRDADFTDCPGNAAYGTLPDIRTAVRTAMSAGFVSPTVSATSAMMAAGSIGVQSNVIGKQSWTLTVRDAGGKLVKTQSGSASRTTKIGTRWDLTDGNGTPVLPGTYTLRLTGQGTTGLAAVPWSTKVTVTPPVSIEVPKQTGLAAAVVAHGSGIPGHSATVSIAAPGGPQHVGAFAVSSSGRWTAKSVSASRDLVWTVSDPAVPNYSTKRTTRVGPTVTTPTAATSFVPSGTTLSLRGSALPGTPATVTLMTQPAGTTTPVTGTTVAVQPDGSWTTSFVPSGPTAYWVTDGRGLVSAHRFVYPVSSPAASAPTEGYAGRSIRLSGNAGHAPVQVTVSAKRPGAAWALVRTLTARTDGTFATGLPLAGDEAGSSVTWKVTTGYGAPVTGAVQVNPVFTPTVTGPKRSDWNAVHVISGTAVPGDKVTIWTAKAGTTKWSAQGAVPAAADKTWSFPLTFTGDTAWRVTSRSGTSRTGTTVVVPTIKAPTTAAARSRVVLSGRAIPGQSLTVFRRSGGSAAAWTVARTVTVGSDGTWTLVRYPRSTVSFRVTSHGQMSRTVTVTVR
jgi:hypothetical protein